MPSTAQSGVEPAEYRVAVLLSAYGRSPFLAEQLASMRTALTPQDILVIVDDGSSQVEWEALGDWPHHYLCWSRLQGLGSAASFLDLLLNAPVRARYYCWADQDDIWRADKLSRQVQALDAAPDAWACVHGWRYLRQGADGAWAADGDQQPLVQRSCAHFCFETPAPGMTLCMTEDARQLLLSFDAQKRSRLLADIPHDRLACAVLGARHRLQCVADALVDYRQHPHNLIGAPQPGMLARALRRLRRGSGIWRSARAGLALYRQLMADQARSGQPLPPLAGQTLRASAWESWVLRAWVRW